MCSMMAARLPLAWLFFPNFPVHHTIGYRALLPNTAAELTHPIANLRYLQRPYSPEIRLRQPWVLGGRGGRH